MEGMMEKIYKFLEKYVFAPVLLFAATLAIAILAIVIAKCIQFIALKV